MQPLECQDERGTAPLLQLSLTRRIQDHAEEGDEEKTPRDNERKLAGLPSGEDKDTEEKAACAHEDEKETEGVRKDSDADSKCPSEDARQKKGEPDAEVEQKPDCKAACEEE